MHKDRIIVDVENWVRVGAGVELQFFATDQEVQRWLENLLPADLGPYMLLGADRIKQDDAYIERPFRIPISEFAQCAAEYQGRRFDYWLRSEVLTPNYPALEGQAIGAMCAVNGLIELQHGLLIELAHRVPRAPYLDSSRISMVKSFRNLRTGKIRQTRGYEDLFATLKRGITKDLVYSSVYKFPDGHEEDDPTLARMTEGAVQKYREGNLYVRTPGKRLKSS